MRLSAAPDDSFKGMNILRQNIYRLLFVRNRSLNYTMNTLEDNCIDLYSYYKMFNVNDINEYNE